MPQEYNWQRRIAKPVPIQLDKTRHLLMDFNALCAFEDVTGQSIPAKDFSNLSMRDIRALVWAGLSHEDFNLTLEDVGRMLSMGSIAEIADAIRDSLSNSMPDNTEAPPDTRPLVSVPDGTGQDSGP